MKSTDEEVYKKTKHMILASLEEGVALRLGFAQAWELVYSQKMSDASKDTMMDIFLLGCYHCFKVTVIVNDHEENDEECMRRMQSIQDELEEFVGIYQQKYASLLENAAKRSKS